MAPMRDRQGTARHPSADRITSFVVNPWVALQFIANFVRRIGYLHLPHRLLSCGLVAGACAVVAIAVSSVVISAVYS